MSAVWFSRRLTAWRVARVFAAGRGVSDFLFDRGRGLVGGHRVLFVGPRAEVYELATLGAEGAMRVAFPLDGFTADGTLHMKARGGQLSALSFKASA